MGVVAVGERNKMLDAWAGRGAYSANAAVYVQLHVGAPGTDGTANVASETDRVQATFGSAAASGAISNTAVIEWLSVAANETYNNVTFWTAAAAGTYLGQDVIADAPVTAGDTFRIPVGDLDITVSDPA